MSKLAKLGITLLCSTMLFVAGCHHFIGGGWFPGLFGGKAHFGFNMKCAETGEAGPNFPWVFYDGNMQFMDKSADVRFHGDFVWSVAVFDGVSSCKEAAEDILGGQFGGSMFEAIGIMGTCRTQPGNVPGTLSMALEDNGTPGASAGDFISVSTDCTADGSFYTHSGALGGGNIKSNGHHK